MRYIKSLSMGFLLITLSILPTTKTHAQLFDAIQEAIRQALIAADIAVQKAQSAVIDLQNTQKEVENQLSQLNLSQIGDWEQKTKDIYSNYFDELWKVKTVISYFRQITTIIAQQKQLVGQYQSAYSAIKQDNHFTPSEVTYIYSVYSGIIDESVKSADQILLILTSFSLQMSDADRLKIISKASADIQQQTNDLNSFTAQNAQLSLRRAKDAADLQSIKQLYGITN